MREERAGGRAKNPLLTYSLDDKHTSKIDLPRALPLAEKRSCAFPIGQQPIVIKQGQDVPMHGRVSESASANAEDGVRRTGIVGRPVSCILGRSKPQQREKLHCACPRSGGQPV